MAATNRDSHNTRRFSFYPTSLNIEAMKEMIPQVPLVGNGGAARESKYFTPGVPVGEAAVIRPGVQTLVELRVTFVKILQVDTVNERYQADIFLQARWREPKLDNGSPTTISEIRDTSGFWNPRLFIENAIGNVSESISQEIQFREGEREAYMLEKRRIKGTFLETLELRHFPFDCQDLSLCVTSELSHEDVELVESPRSPSRVNNQAFVDSQEWDLHHHVDVHRFDRITECDVGPHKRSYMIFTSRASRRFGYFFFNNVVISILLCLLSFASFAVPNNNTHGRLQLSFLLLLTTITFKVVTSQSLPKISYLTYLDILLLGNLSVLVLICIWHAAVAKYLYSSDPNFNKHEYVIIGVLACVYIGGLVVFVIVIYFDAGARRRQMKHKDRKFLERLKDIRDGELFSTKKHDTKF